MATFSFSSSTPGRIKPKGRQASLPGDSYGSLTLIKPADGYVGSPSLASWVCLCVCGRETLEPLNRLKAGHVGSCGCLLYAARALKSRPRLGDVFGRLTVLELFKVNRSLVYWSVRCSCGSTLVVEQNALKSGGTRSCGCLKSEKVRDLNTRHGRSGTSLYRIWQGMKKRCGNQGDKHWSRYGGRGITVCERWRTSFEAFIADMGERPAGKSLDRINNDLGYSPENCRWATTSEQNRNKRNTLFLVLSGKKMSLSDAAEFRKIPYDKVYSRIRCHGWPAYKALEVLVEECSEIMCKKVSKT